MYDVLASAGKCSVDEALLVVHFLEHATMQNAYGPNTVAVGTTHYAQMIWLLHCVWRVGETLCGEKYKYQCLQIITTLDRYQGLQAPVILASLVSSTPGIMKDVVRANTLTSRAQSELHLFGPFNRWYAEAITGNWLKGLQRMADAVGQGGGIEGLETVRLPGVMWRQATLHGQLEGFIYTFKGGVVGHWLWKPPKKHKHARDPWAFAPPYSDQLLEWERIMCNKRSEKLLMQMRVRDGDVVPLHLGVTFPDFTDWALPYVLLQDTAVCGYWEEIPGLEELVHTSALEQWEKKLVQFLAQKPLAKEQGYLSPPPPRAAKFGTVELGVWREAYAHLELLPFLQNDFCTPLGVYVASLLHGVKQYDGVRAPVVAHQEPNCQCA